MVLFSCLESTETTRRQKMSEKGKPRANFCIEPGSTIFLLAAGLVTQLLEKAALERDKS